LTGLKLVVLGFRGIFLACLFFGICQLAGIAQSGGNAHFGQNPQLQRGPHPDKNYKKKNCFHYYFRW
jgi:hypothetical protein